MRGALAAWCRPRAIWSREARAHARWLRRCARADAADRRGATFRYKHPLVGTFLYHPSHYLSRRIYLHDDFELRELQFAIDRAREGGIVLDVGANIGFYTTGCARAAGERGRVIAIEPGPATFARLTATCTRLSLSNVTLLNVAAASRPGSAQLLLEPGGRDVHQHLTDEPVGDVATVATQPLDDMCGDPTAVTLVKIDIEGREFDALTGATRILENGRARLIVEFYPRGLAAAGASVDALRRLLTRTHVCTAAIGHDGTMVEGESALAVEPAGEPVNTFWIPIGR